MTPLNVLQSVAELYNLHSFELLPYDDASGGHSWWENQNCHDFELDCFKELAKSLQITNALEIGSFVGVGGIKLFENSSSLRRLVCVDPWLWPGAGHKGAYFRQPFDQFCSNITHKGLAEFVFPWRATSAQAASTNKEVFDLIHVDAIHDCEHVLLDLTAWQPFLGKNGILGGDDWLPWGPHESVQIVQRDINPETFQPFSDVQRAVQLFLQTRKYTLNACLNYFWMTQQKA